MKPSKEHKTRKLSCSAFEYKNEKKKLTVFSFCFHEGSNGLSKIVRNNKQGKRGKKGNSKLFETVENNK